jgi:hypothetical protein
LPDSIALFLVRAEHVVRIVHEGRSGYIEIEGRRYVIEHVEGGRFCVYFPSNNRRALRAGDLAMIEQLVRDEPAKWSIEHRSRARDEP